VPRGDGGTAQQATQHGAAQAREAVRALLRDFSVRWTLDLSA
jgi:hypothetical protein